MNSSMMVGRYPIIDVAARILTRESVAAEAECARHHEPPKIVDVRSAL
jgi:hypothetical protein